MSCPDVLAPAAPQSYRLQAALATGAAGCLGLETDAAPRVSLCCDAGAHPQLVRVLAQAGFELDVVASLAALGHPAPPGPPSCLIVDLRSTAADYDLGRLGALCGAYAVVFFASRPTAAEVVQVMRAGAVDFLELPCSSGALLQAIGTALHVSRRRRAAAERHGELRARFATLTPRERQVMALVTAGLLNKQIAFDLGLSEITVKVHRGAAMRKMAARSLAELVRMADAVRALGPDGLDDRA